MLLCSFCGFLPTPPLRRLSLLLFQTQTSFLKRGSPYLLSPLHHTYNPSVLSTNLNLIKLFPFPLPNCLSSRLFLLLQPVCSLFFFFSPPRRLPPTSLGRLLGRDSVSFEKLRLIQQRVPQKFLLIKKKKKRSPDIKYNCPDLSPPPIVGVVA